MKSVRHSTCIFNAEPAEPLTQTDACGYTGGARALKGIIQHENSKVINISEESHFTFFCLLSQTLWFEVLLRGRMKFYLQHLGWVCVPLSAVTLEVLGSSWWTASSSESTLLLFWAFIPLIYSLFMHRNITSGPWNIVVSMDKSTLPCMFNRSCTAKVHYFCLITLDWRAWRLYLFIYLFLSQVVLMR